MDQIRRWIVTLTASVAALLGLASEIDTTQPRTDAACQAAYTAVSEQAVFSPTPQPEPQPEPDPTGDANETDTEDAEQVGSPSGDAEGAAVLAPPYGVTRGPLRRLLRRVRR